MSRNANPLARQIQAAADLVLSQDQFSAFKLHDKPDRASFRSYVCSGPNVESEISIYRGKQWSRNGGNVYVELYCLNSEYQMVMGGCEQSWLKPNYGLPLHYFQYRTSKLADDMVFSVGNDADVVGFGEWLRSQLVENALPWFQQFSDPTGIESYLLSEGSTFAAAKWLACSGRAEEGRKRFTEFLRDLPRQIDRQLGEAEALGLIGAEEAKFLALASIQQEETYRQRVAEWVEPYGA